MTLGKLFTSADEQAVLLPKEFRLPGDVVEVTRRGDELVLRPLPQPDMRRAIELLCQLSDAFLEPPPDPLPEELEGL